MDVRGNDDSGGAQRVRLPALGSGLVEQVEGGRLDGRRKGRLGGGLCSSTMTPYGVGQGEYRIANTWLQKNL